MSEKDYLLTEAELGEEDPFKIANLRQASIKELKEVQIIQDYVFCSLLATSRLNFLDPKTLSEQEKAEVTVEQVLFHGYMIVVALRIQRQDESSIIIKKYNMMTENSNAKDGGE